MGQMSDKIKQYTGRYLLKLLLAAAVLVNIKSIFCDFDVDGQYATVMSWRMLRGDHMFLDMWEPHQTSAFLTTFLMWIFVKVTGSVNGVILWLHTAGVLLHGTITWLLWLFLRDRADRRAAALMCIFFLAARPKDMVYPEFSNMQLWFSVLFFMCMVLHLEAAQKSGKKWLFVAALCLSAEVVAYPSCVAVAVGGIILLWVYSEDKWKDILVLMGTCAAAGFVYVGYFALRIGLPAFVQGLQNMISTDGSHQWGSRLSFVNYFGKFGESLLWIVVCFIITVALFFLIFFAERFLHEEKERNADAFWGSGQYFAFLFSLVLLSTDVLRALVQGQRIAYGAIYVVLIAVALWRFKHCGDALRRLVCVGMVISGCTFVATILLTNIDMLYTVMYLVLAVMVSFLPLAAVDTSQNPLPGHRMGYRILIVFCIGILLRRGMMVKTPTGLSRPMQLGGIVRSGPAKGIVMDYMGAFVINSTMEEWDNYVHDGDSILIVGSGGVSTLAYMYADTNISMSSTTCTPTYNEKILDYWAAHPEKYPDCVIVQCWYGELGVAEDSWIMKWITNEYSPAVSEDGAFWRYYRADG